MQRKKIIKTKIVRRRKLTEKELARKRTKAYVDWFLEVEAPKYADELSLL